MKKSISLLWVFFFLVSSVAMATGHCTEQQKEEQRNRMTEFLDQKRDYLEKEVGMTQAEVKAFFPLYNELQQKKFALHRDIRSRMKKMEARGSEITDAEYLDTTHAINEMRLKEAQLDKDYYYKFAKILPPQKLYKLQKAENGFAKEMMRRGPRHGEMKKANKSDK